MRRATPRGRAMHPCYNPDMTSHTTSRMQKLERLLDICRSLGMALDPQQVLHTVVGAAMEVLESEAASILLYDAETNQLRFAAAPPAHWQALKGQTVPLRNSLAGKALVEHKPVVQEHVASSEQHFRGIDRLLQFTTRNLMAVPLLREDEPLGVLEVLNKRAGAFTPEDMELASILASQAAVALHNARLLAEAQRAYRELRRVDDMKSDFIAIASHELRTPLGIILGYATHLQEVLSEPYESPLRAIVRAALQLKDIVEELSHLENFQQNTAVLGLQEVDVRELIAGVVARFKMQAQERQIALEVRLPPQPVVATVDPDKVTIILRHLLKNALAFTDKGGRVLVELRPYERYFQIAVSDTGVGIPAEDLPHIFDRFYQVEKHLTRHHGGLGLGLSIAKAMAEAHRGTIWAESEEGKGTVVTVLLPRHPEQEKARQVFAT